MDIKLLLKLDSILYQFCTIIFVPLNDNGLPLFTITMWASLLVDIHYPRGRS